MKISRANLLSVIDEDFWKTITKDTQFPDVNQFRDIKREEILGIISEKIFENSYKFTNPIEFYTPKQQGILRKKELFILEDLCIYYFCVKSIQDQIVEKVKSNPNVYGVFRMTRELATNKKDTEKFEVDDISDGYGSKMKSSGYKADWNEYQSIALSIYEKKYDKYINIDIAHFYNDIDLDILERQVRSLKDSDPEIVNLLFHLLRNHKVGELGFYQGSRSIPQEDLGEMSRLLANLYLNPFDTAISRRPKKVLGETKFEYTRYSDDMWLGINGDKETAFKVIQIISFELSKLRLFINEGKLQILEHDDFRYYWCFDLWEEIFSLNATKNFSHDDWFKIIDKTTRIAESKKNARWFSPQLYAIKAFSSIENPMNYLNREKKAAKMLNILLGAERNLEKSNSGMQSLVYSILRKYPSLRSRIDQNIGGSLYPSMEYFSLKISIGLDATPLKHEDYEKYCRIFLSPFVNKWQWYSRCLILKHLAEYAYLIDGADENMTRRVVDTHDLTGKIMRQFIANKHTTNYLERRYQIYFLARFRSMIDIEDIKHSLDGVYEKSLWKALVASKLRPRQ